MSAEKDANLFKQGLEEIRKTVESKDAETGESINKIQEITKELGDKHEEMQKKFEKQAEEKTANQKELDLLKEKIEHLYKEKSRPGTGSAKELEEELYKKYSGDLDKYFRRGLASSQENIDNIARNIVSKMMPTQDEKTIEYQKSLVSGSNPDG